MNANKNNNLVSANKDVSKSTKSLKNLSNLQMVELLGNDGYQEVKENRLLAVAEREAAHFTGKTVYVANSNEVETNWMEIHNKSEMTIAKPPTKAWRIIVKDEFERLIVTKNGIEKRVGDVGEVYLGKQPKSLKRLKADSTVKRVEAVVLEQHTTSEVITLESGLTSCQMLILKDGKYTLLWSKEGDHTIKGTHDTCRHIVGETKFGIVVTGENDLNNFKIVLFDNPEAKNMSYFTLLSLANTSRMRSIGYLMNMIATDLVPDRFIDELLTYLNECSNADINKTAMPDAIFPHSKPDGTPAKMQALQLVVAFVCSSMFMSRVIPGLRICFPGTEHLTNHNDEAMRKIQLMRGEMVCKFLNMPKLLQSTIQQKASVERLYAKKPAKRSVTSIYRITGKNNMI